MKNKIYSHIHSGFKTHYLKSAFAFVALSLVCSIAFAQTELIPASDGGLENATSTFAANNWSTALGTTARNWMVGTIAGSVTGGTKSAYLGSATAHNGIANATSTHIYKDVAIPAGATNVLFTFYLKQPIVDNTFDFIRVYTTTTANTPVGGTTPGAGYTQVFSNTATTYASFTQMAAINLNSFAGSTVRLVFTFISDGVTPNANPAIDNVSLTYVAGGACFGTPNPGNTVSSLNPVCSGVSFTLSLQNSTSGSGVNYQWQSASSSSGPWSNVGSNSATFATSETVSTWYQCVVSCSGGGTGTSNPLQVALNGSGFPVDFASSTFPPSCWTNSNVTYLFRSTTSANGVGVGSAEFNFYSQTSGTDNLTSPVFTPTISGMVLSFDHAYATFAGENDQMRIRTSSNGGSSFTNLITYAGGTSGPLNTGGTTTNDFVPAANQWANKTVALPTGTNVIQFQGLSAFGNNLFLDNINIIVPTLPSCAINTFPANSATDIDCSAGLSWAAGSSGSASPSGYDVYFGTNSTPPLVSSNQSAASYNPGTLSVNSVYYWQVVPRNSAGTASGCPIMSFTVAPVCYCVPAYTFTPCGCCDGDLISNFTMNGFSFNSGCTSTNTNSFSFTSSPVIQVNNGQTVAISTTTDLFLTEGLNIWIDMNNNGSFEDVGEFWVTAGPFAGTATGNIALPCMTPGTHRMRVRLVYNTVAFNSCNSQTFGETEDYLINVIATPPSPIGTVTLNHVIGCGATDLVIATVSSYSGNLAWQYSIDNGANWLTIPSANTSPVTLSINTAGNYKFRAISNCSSTSNEVDYLLDNVASPTNPVGAQRCGPGNVSVSATVPSGKSINWYNASTGGTFLANGNSYSASINSTTDFYAATLNPVTGCESTSRTKATATVNPLPAIALTASPGIICSGQQTATLSANVTNAGSAQQPLSFVNTTPLAIPDGGAIVWSDLNVSGITPGIIASGTIVSVQVNINHTFVGDLRIRLRCPDLTIINLADQIGGGGVNYTNTVFSPNASTSITAGSAPFTGTFLPQQPFSNLNGCNANGTWSLGVRDFAALDVGTLMNWTITFNTGTGDAFTYTFTPDGNLTGASTGSVTGNSVVSLVANPPNDEAYVATFVNTQTGCSNTASTSVTVNRAPTISTQANISVNTDLGECSAIVNYNFTTTGTPSPSVSYSVAGSGALDPNNNYNPANSGSGTGSGLAFNKGLSTVTVTVSNSCGTVTRAFNITVSDNEYPLIAQEPNLSVFNYPGNCAKSIAIVIPAFSDNCPLASISGLRDDAEGLSTEYPVGTTTITWTAVDASGNTSWYDQFVTVDDNEIPSITCPVIPPLPNTTGLCSRVVTYSANANDNCGIFGIVHTPPSGSSFPVGTTTVMAVATDIHGNTNSCTFPVIIEDKQVPNITSCAPAITFPPNTAPCKGKLSGCSAVALGAPTATDNCTPSGSLVKTPRVGNAAGALVTSSTLFNMPTNIVHWTVTDGVGNSSTCLQAISIASTKPVVTSVVPSTNVFFMGSTVTVTASWHGDCYQLYSWTMDWDDGTSSAVQNSVPVTGNILSDGSGNASVIISHTFPNSEVAEPKFSAKELCGNKVSDLVGGVSTIQYLIVSTTQTSRTTAGGYYMFPSTGFPSSFNGSRINVGNAVGMFQNGNSNNISYKGEFQSNRHQVNDFRVHTSNTHSASTMEFYVVQGCSLAFFKTAARLNGNTGYHLTVWQTDKDRVPVVGNKIRVKVTQDSNGAIVYDTQPGASDAVLPSTSLAQGTIKIHNNATSGCTARELEASGMSNELLQNIPNPFSGQTEIGFSVPEDGKYTLKIYNYIGEEVATLFNEEAFTGEDYKVNFDGSNLKSGIYFYTLSGNNFRATRKMNLMK